MNPGHRPTWGIVAGFLLTTQLTDQYDQFDRCGRNSVSIVVIRVTRAVVHEPV